MLRLLRLAVAAVSASLLALAGSSLPAVSQDPEGEAPTVVLAIEEGKASEQRQTRFLRSGAVDAAGDLGVTLDVRPLRGSIDARLDLLDRIRADDPAGLVVAAEDPGRLGDGISALAADGVPVVITWGGIDVWKELGAVAFVGVDERDAGRLAGERLAEIGATNALCVLDNVTDQRLDDRCAGAIEAFEEAGGQMDLLRALDPPGDPTGVRDAIASRLFEDPPFDAVLATEDDGARWAVRAIERTGRGDQVRLATFDPTPEILRSLADGDLAFAVETQPYLQGYLPVLFLGQWAERGLMPGGGEPVLTGPRLLDSQEARRRVRLAER